MAAPKSREAVMMSLKLWAMSLTPRSLGIRGEVNYLPIMDTRSSVIIRVQDDHEQEVIDYKITIREVEPQGGSKW
jgi:hypothetical protein